LPGFKLGASFQGLMTNPEALAAITQIQEGLQRLQRAAPDLYQSMGWPSVGLGTNLFAGVNVIKLLFLRHFKVRTVLVSFSPFQAFVAKS
jgi:hypothetical protein